MENRESLGSRLGFILLSAGCAIGIGNVWRFPYITGQYGGGFFVLMYVIFLVLLGIPVLTMEYAIGRATRQSILPAFQKLEPSGGKWHLWGYIAMAGNYVLLFFYSVIAGWILYYTYLMISGKFVSAETESIGLYFEEMKASPAILIGCMLVVVLLTAVVCSIGLKNSVESITKFMMLALIVLMLILGLRSLTLPGAREGLSFYLKPSLENIRKAGWSKVVYAALNQSFFTLSIGMGGMEIYGSYIDKRKSLTGEALIVTGLDTMVAIVSGLIIFPACFAYGIAPDAGPSLIFLTLPRVFSGMAGGRIWGSLFFIFLFFAAFSTMIGVFENTQAFLIDIRGIKRKTAGIFNGLLIALMSVPCALGFNLWSHIQPLGSGRNIMDLEDFFVSNICLPIGSFLICLFCTWKFGWGFENYRKEANEGEGIRIPAGLKFYFKFILPILVGFLALYGIITYF